MTPFSPIRAVAAPLALDNVDTDKILPAKFLKTVARSGLGNALFWQLRQDSDFILNRTPWTQARILITGDNFGCGSSREHAPWALWDFGIRAIAAPSFADIFHNNCLKNGILPLILPRAEINRWMMLAMVPESAEAMIDLVAQTVTLASGDEIGFDIDPGRKRTLIAGQDDIQLTLGLEAEICAFERRHADAHPWLPRIASFQSPSRRGSVV